MQRFNPKYWTCNFNVDCAASVVAPAADSLLVTIDFRTTRDLVGLIWASTDLLSHQLYRYGTNNDYTGSVLDFDFALVNIRALDAINGPTLTVTHADGNQSFVRLSNYITSGSATVGHCHLPLASVLGGFFATDPINWTDVTEIFISLVGTSYDPVLPSTPLVVQVVGTFTMSNIVVTGPTLTQSTNVLEPIPYRLADDYDDSYTLAPGRFVEQMAWLGYRSWYSLYLGISHHHSTVWDAGENRFVVLGSAPYLNAATEAWLSNLFSELRAVGIINVNISVSYEIVNYLMPLAWRQIDASGNPGLSGWVPPSEFIIPTYTVPLDYLANVLKASLALFLPGMIKYFQIGEPWWWDNSFTSGEPCFYDPVTVALYPVETGHAVPTPYLTSTTESIVGYSDWLAWLGQKLGDSTLYIRNSVKATWPDAGSTILIYTPQIFATAMMQLANLPLAEWLSPNWDVLQLEDYDWVIQGKWELHQTTWTTGANLGYSPARTQYFSGFNLMPGTAAVVWPNVFQALQDSVNRGNSENWIWARPQVFRDGIAYQPTASNSSNAKYQGIPRLDTPFVNPDLTIDIPWYKFLISLWQKSGGAAVSAMGNVYLALVNGHIEAFSSATGADLGTIITTGTAGGNPVPQTLGTSPFVFTAPVSGTLVVDGGQIEFKRGAGGWYQVGLVGGTIPLRRGDSIRVTWFGAVAPPTVFLPD